MKKTQVKRCRGNRCAKSATCLHAHVRVGAFGSIFPPPEGGHCGYYSEIQKKQISWYARQVMGYIE